MNSHKLGSIKKNFYKCIYNNIINVAFVFVLLITLSKIFIKLIPGHKH